MATARRKRSRMSPATVWLSEHREMAFGFMLAIMIIILLVFANLEKSAPRLEAQPQLAPAPTATYTTYVPQKPAACYDMVDAGVDMYDQTQEYAKANTDASLASARQQFVTAREANARAERENKKLAALQKKFLAAATKCEDAK